MWQWIHFKFQKDKMFFSSNFCFLSFYLEISRYTIQEGKFSRTMKWLNVQESLHLNSSSYSCVPWVSYLTLCAMFYTWTSRIQIFFNRYLKHTLRLISMNSLSVLRKLHSPAPLSLGKHFKQENHQQKTPKI